MASKSYITRLDEHITFEWFISHSLLSSQEIDSPTIKLNEKEWQLVLYPYGFYYNANGHASIFLQPVYRLCDDLFDRKIQATVSLPEWGLKQSLQSMNRRYGHYKLCKRRTLIESDKNLKLVCRIDLSDEINNGVEPQGISSNPRTINSEEGQLTQDLQFLFKEPKLSDVSIIVGTEKFPAHKVILAARSPVFSAMFENKETQENQKNEVRIENMDPDVVKAMLEFFYTDEVTNQEELACGLLEAANKYEIPRLRLLCDKFLRETLNNENAVEYLIYADLHRSYELKNHILEYVVDHVIHISESASYKEMEKNYPALSIELLHSIIARKKSRK